MDAPGRPTLGDGSLTASGVIADVLGMLRQSLARISTAALLFFAFPALVAVVAEHALSSLAPDHGAAAALVVYSAVILAVSLRVLGPVAFAGYLDEAVAKQYFHGTR